MAAYDPKLICRFANGLYRRARYMTLFYTFMGVLGGIGFGSMIAEYSKVTASPSTALISALTGINVPQPFATPRATPKEWSTAAALLGGIFGCLIGWGKGAALKLQAQTALCQVRIEENTNPAMAQT